MARIDVLHATKRYEAVVAVDDLSLDVPDGSFVVLLGPSGCGKSTLLKLIAGLEDLTSGEIYVDGELVNYVPPVKRDVAMVFQNYALYPHMTVRQNIAFPLRMARVDKQAINERVLEVARILNIEDLLARHPEEISGGQRQRVALGRAIIRNPRAFLMDEPLSNLDAKLRLLMREELLSLHRRLAGTVLYVTHDQVEAMTMGDRITVLRSGRVEQSGAPQEIYDRPANTYVATFVGSPAMNLFEGRLVAASGSLWFESPDLRVELPARLRAAAALPVYRTEESVTLGVRCEDVAMSVDSRTGEVDATISLVETVGSDVFVRLAVKGAVCTVRTEPHSGLHEGQPVRLTFSAEGVHLFDENGRRMAAEP